MAILSGVGYFGESFHFFKEFPDGVTFDELSFSHQREEVLLRGDYGG